jgi:lysophospholipase L1-like esterase
LEAKRYSFGERWTGALQRELGEKYTVIEEGLSGRTAGVDAAFWNLEGIEPEDQNFNGRRSLLPVVWSHEPLSAVVIMLGTNDARNFLKQSIFDVEASVTTLIRLVKNGSTPGQKPKILLISPPPARKGESELFNTIFGESAYELSLRYGAVFREIAGREGVSFFDAAAVIPVADGIDGLHLSPGANMKLGAAVARELRAMLE